MQAYIAQVQEMYTRYPSIFFFTSTAVISLPLVLWVRQNYLEFLKVRRLPSDIRGYIFAMFVKPFGRETISTAMYDQDTNKDQWLTPDELPARRGERPAGNFHFAPHRQSSQFSNESMHEV
jgi:hypothetical protein